MCRLVHRGVIEGPRNSPTAVELERQIRAAIKNAIEVMPLHRRGAGVEVVAHALGRQHRDRMRPQLRVERVANGVGFPVAAQIDMRDLATRVYAGIGAAGALYRRPPTGPRGGWLRAPP